MDNKTYYKTASVVFLLIAIFHFLRVIYDWEAVIGGYVIPIWFSWFAVILAGYLSARGFHFAKRL
jgi:hypothetical protein